MYIETKNFGKCKILVLLNDTALIQLDKNIERYVIAIGISQAEGRWNIGYYSNNFEEACEIFNNVIDELYTTDFKV